MRLKLTALNFQGAVLLVQRVSPQIHHAGRCRRDSESRQNQKTGIQYSELVLYDVKHDVK